MPSYDVVVIGAGAAGLSAGAPLAKEGKRVVVLDRGPYLGGWAMAVPDGRPRTARGCFRSPGTRPTGGSRPR
jgi:flavin-dependent dehydrogenase